MISKKFIASEGRELWGFDLRISQGGKSVRVRRFVFDTRREAEDAAASIRRADRDVRYGVVAPQMPRLADLVPRYLERVQNRNDRVRAKRVLALWLTLLPPQVHIHEIKPPKILLYSERRKADGVSNVTIDRELNAIAACLHSAPEFYEELEHWRAPKIPRLPINQNPTKRIISDDEYRKLIAWLRNPERLPNEQAQSQQARFRCADILSALMLTGMRPGELMKLRWSDYSADTEPPILTVRGTKTAHRKDSVRSVVVAPALRELIERQDRGGAFIFSEQGGAITWKQYGTIRRACEACGIPYGKSVVGGLQFRHSRATMATRLLRAGHEIQVIGRMLGHTPKVMLDNYAGIVPSSEAEIAKSVQAIEENRTSSQRPK